MNELIDKIVGIVGWEAIITIIGLVGVLVVVVVNALILTWAERKVSAHMQRRIGPKEVGPFGLIQPIADTIKLISKELLTPKNVERPLYFLAPVIVFIPVMVAFVVIPFDSYLQVKDINVGILVVLAFSSLSVLSILLAGWGSNNKYSLIGSVRSVAQNIAYEIPLLLRCCLLCSWQIRSLSRILWSLRKGSGTLSHSQSPFLSFSLREWQKRTEPPLICRKQKASSLQDSIQNTQACVLPSSFWQNTPICSSYAPLQPPSFLVVIRGLSCPASYGFSERLTFLFS